MCSSCLFLGDPDLLFCTIRFNSHRRKKYLIADLNEGCIREKALLGIFGIKNQWGLPRVENPLDGVRVD